MGKSGKKSNHYRYGGSGDHEWSRNRTPLTDAQRDMAGANIGLAGKFAADMAARRYGGFTRDELFSIGCEGLVRAARAFRPAEGNRFATYAFAVMHRRAALEARNNHLIRIPVNSRRRDAIRAVRGRFAAVGEGDCRVDDRPGDGGEYDADDLARLDRALARLDARSRDIVGRRAEGQSLDEIRRSYRVSKERVRQIAIEAIGLLRKWLGVRGDASCA